MDFWTSLGSYGVKMAVAISENPLSDFEQELLVAYPKSKKRMPSASCQREDDQDSPQWYDDHIFNEFQEDFCEITFRGDHWRRLMQLKEEYNITTVFSVKGTSFRKVDIERAFKHAHTTGGMRLALVPEPSNIEDPNAIRVEVNSYFVGYVPEHYKIPKGVVCRVAKFGTYPRPHVVIAY